MPRFVILRHETPPGHARGLHWDLMLEAGGVLRTWALAEEPQPGKSIAAELLPDHRLDYLDYEGAVSGDRGNVTRWDAGEFQTLVESASRLAISITGARIRGTASLQKDARNTGSDPWTFSFVSV
jgi:hypothetical protein